MGRRLQHPTVGCWLLATTALVGVPAQAAVLRVGPDAIPTIQAAVDVAEDGDLIQVAAGDFHEQVRIVGKDLTIAGVGFVPNGENTAIDLSSLLPNGVAPDGRTVAAGVLIEGARVVLQDLEIRNDTLSYPLADLHAGVAVLGAESGLEMNRCFVNGFDRDGGQVSTVGSSCGLGHLDLYAFGVGILAIDAAELRVIDSAASGNSGLAAICTKNVSLTLSFFSASIFFDGVPVHLVSHRGRLLNTIVNGGAVGVLVEGDQNRLAHTALDRMDVGLQFNGNDNWTVGSTFLDVGTEVMDLGNGNVLH